MGVRELLEAYAEGERRKTLGATYDLDRKRGEQALELGEARLGQVPLQTEALEQRLEHGELGIDDLRRRAEEHSTRLETIRGLVGEGKLPEGYDVDPAMARYLEGAPDRQTARAAGQVGLDTATRQYESLPSVEEAQAARAAGVREREARATYYSSGGRPLTPSKYTGAKLDEDVFNAARQEAMATLGDAGVLPNDVYFDKGAFKRRKAWAVDEDYQLSLEDLNMIHQLTLQRLMAAGFSPEMLERSGLSLQGASQEQPEAEPEPVAGPVDDEDPLGLGR